MKVQEIFNKITKEDIERAIVSFETKAYKGKASIPKYRLSHKGKQYPVCELVNRASGGEMDKASNKSSFNSIGCKEKLTELGYKEYADDQKLINSENKMYFYKIVKKQDISGEFFIPAKLIGIFDFFPNPKVADPKPKGDAPSVSNLTVSKWINIEGDEKIVIKKYNAIKQTDFRISPTPLIDKSLVEKSVLKFEKLNGNSYNISVIDSGKPEYDDLLKRIQDKGYKKSYLIEGNTIQKTTKTTSEPLNQILFGPPGTGKTDSTVEKSLEILDMKTGDRETDRETFRSLLNKKIFFVTMHPSYSYEDFVEGIKPKTSAKGELLFEPRPGIFKTVSDLAKTVYEDDGEMIETDINNRDLLRIFYFLSKFNIKADKKASNYFGAKSYSDTYKIVGEKFDVNPNTINNHVDKFDFLASTERAGWKPRNGSIDKLDNSEIWPYNDIYTELKDKTFEEVKDIVKDIEKKAKTATTKTEQNINYVLILDEINRANISKVFGELITLLEEDKRIGNENELSVTLPSGEVFAVPSNLYVIGTMNTADKSIALVDIALRRRFQFIPVYPDPAVIEDHCKSEDREEKKIFMISLNTMLRKEKGVDFQIGHAYFLKSNSLAQVINENIIPLLTEYFRNDLDKVRKHMKGLGNSLDEEYFNTTGLLTYTK
jgi:hypothetical protein